jgi:L-gulonate 5-dehydrogenase
MRAAIMQAPFSLEIGTVETPRPGPGDVLVSVGAAGICAGDMYIYQGKNPYARYPQVAGHEIAGTVAEVGAGVSGIEAGARVAVEPFIGCGSCYPCRVGKPNCCARLSRSLVSTAPAATPTTSWRPRGTSTGPAGMSLLEASFAEPVAIGVQSCRRGALAPRTSSSSGAAQ